MVAVAQPRPQRGFVGQRPAHAVVTAHFQTFAGGLRPVPAWCKAKFHRPDTNPKDAKHGDVAGPVPGIGSNHSMIRPSGPICVGASRSRVLQSIHFGNPRPRQEFLTIRMHAPNKYRTSCCMMVGPMQMRRLLAIGHLKMIFRRIGRRDDEPVMFRFFNQHVGIKLRRAFHDRICPLQKIPCPGVNR